MQILVEWYQRSPEHSWNKLVDALFCLNNDQTAILLAKSKGVDWGPLQSKWKKWKKDYSGELERDYYQKKYEASLQDHLIADILATDYCTLPMQSRKHKQHTSDIKCLCHAIIIKFHDLYNSRAQACTLLYSTTTEQVNQNLQ